VPSDALIIVVLGSAVVLVGLMYFLLQGPPFVPTQQDDLAVMLKVVAGIKDPKIIDLGAGDGQLVIGFAKHGYMIDGIEINPWLVRRARKLIKKNVLQANASVEQGSLWHKDTSPYNVVLLYAVPHVMPRLETKLINELKLGSVIISNYFTFPNLKPAKTYGRIKIYKLTAS
jgi:hypothetical protein